MKLTIAKMMEILDSGSKTPSKPRTALQLLAEKRSLLERIERLKELVATKELLAARSPRGHLMDLEGYRDDLLDRMRELSEVELALLKATEETSAIDPSRTLVSAAPALEAAPAERDFIDVEVMDAATVIDHAVTARDDDDRDY
jgi:hypothetical protein